jgi:hypothetical protein
MRRVLLAGVVVVVVMVVMVVARPRDEGPGVRVGPWHGKTSQGHPLKFVVNDDDGKLTLDQWQIRVDLRCQATGRVMGVEFWVGIPIPITDRRFAERFAELTMWISWGGAFPAEDGARGRSATALPVLIGEEFEELRSEKCSAEVAWTALPGQGDDEEGADAPADLKLRVERDGRVTRM